MDKINGAISQGRLRTICDVLSGRDRGQCNNLAQLSIGLHALSYALFLIFKLVRVTNTYLLGFDLTMLILGLNDTLGAKYHFCDCIKIHLYISNQRGIIF